MECLHPGPWGRGLCCFWEFGVLIDLGSLHSVITRTIRMAGLNSFESDCLLAKNNLKLNMIAGFSI